MLQHGFPSSISGLDDVLLICKTPEVLTSFLALGAVLLLGGGPQWQRQVQRHRRHALRVWQEGQAGVLPLTLLPSPAACA